MATDAVLGYWAIIVQASTEGFIEGSVKSISASEF